MPNEAATGSEIEDCFCHVIASVAGYKIVELQVPIAVIVVTTLIGKRV